MLKIFIVLNEKDVQRNEGREGTCNAKGEKMEEGMGKEIMHDFSSEKNK